MKVLLLSDSKIPEDFREKLFFSLEVRLGARLDLYLEENEAIERLKEALKKVTTEPLDLIIGIFSDQSVITQLAKVWKEAGALPVILGHPQIGAIAGAKPLSAASLVANLAKSVSGPDIESEIVKYVGKMLESGRLKREDPTQGYCRVSTGLLVDLNPLQSDIYIKLGEEKFLKLFHAGDKFENSDLEKYRNQKNIEFLHIKAAQMAQFFEKFTQRLKELMGKAGGPSVEDVAGAHAGFHSSVQSMVQTMGITPQVQEVAKLQVATTLKSLQSNKRMSKIVDQIKNSTGYLSQHSLMLAYFSCIIAGRTKWASEKTNEKLCMAAYFHDIILTQPDSARVRSLAEAEALAKSGKIDARELQNIKLHPMRSAELVRQFSEMPFDVDTMILQHHERPNGTGFPRGLKYPRINPLSAILIMAHELVDYMLEHGSKADLHQFVEKMQPYYMGDFETIIESMKFDE